MASPDRSTKPLTLPLENVPEPIPLHQDIYIYICNPSHDRVTYQVHDRRTGDIKFFTGHIRLRWPWQLGVEEAAERAAAMRLKMSNAAWKRDELRSRAEAAVGVPPYGYHRDD